MYVRKVTLSIAFFERTTCQFQRIATWSDQADVKQSGVSIQLTWQGSNFGLAVFRSRILVYPIEVRLTEPVRMHQLSYYHNG